MFLLLSLRSLYKSKRGKLTGEEASKATIVKYVAMYVNTIGHKYVKLTNKILHNMLLYVYYQFYLYVYRTVLKATVILLPLLGITWVFGILAVNQESSVFAWIFTILNSLQVKN